MNYKYSTFFKLINVIIDYSLLNILLVLSLSVIWPFASPLITPEDFKLHLLLINLFWFFCTTQLKLYDKILTTEAIPSIKQTLSCLLLFFLTPIFLSFILPQLILPFSYLFSFLSVFSISILLWKTLFLYVRKSQRRFWIDYKKIIILGSGQAAIDLCNYFEANKNSGYIVAGMFDNSFSDKRRGDKRVIGNIGDCLEYAVKNGISEVFSALPASEIRTVKKLMKEADHKMIRFRLVPDISAFLDKNVLLEYYGSLPILTPRREPLEIKVNEIIKQTFDYLFASFVIVFILSWLFPIIALAIKVDSDGPVFFRQLRSGKDNKPFFCLKFRSMYVNKDSDVLQAERGDKRITRVGAFLRKTSLDELPQFFNVVMGDMSIVGPRPHMIKHTEDYSQVINNFMVRQFVTPGITGWAQVNGYRGETKEASTMSKRVDADIWYLENWSFLLDIKIVFLTVVQTLKRNENAF